MKKYTHDFTFVFSVNTNHPNPDYIPPEKIAERLIETVQACDPQEIFERSEVYNTFEEDIGWENIGWVKQPNSGC